MRCDMCVATKNNYQQMIGNNHVSACADKDTETRVNGKRKAQSEEGSQHALTKREQRQSHAWCTHRCNAGRCSSDDRGAPFANSEARAKANIPVVDRDLIKSLLLAMLTGTTRVVPWFEVPMGSIGKVPAGAVL